MKVLIITYYWPPAGGSGVQRWLKFTKYLQEFDIEPVIYTIDQANYAIEDHSLVKEVPNNIEVIRRPIWEPNDVLSILKKKNTKTSAGFLNPNPSFTGKILQYIRANYFIPDARKFWVKPSVKYLKKYLIKNKIDLIITTGPPHSLHLIGLELKKQLNIKWVSDFRDPWTDIDYFHQLPLTKSSKRKHYLLEEEVLKKSDAVIVIGETMKKNYMKFSKNIHVVTNGFDTKVLNEVPMEVDAKFSITHIGLMNADRNPKILWKVLAEICKENIGFKKDLEIKLIGKIAKEVDEEIEKYQLNNTLKIDYVPHEEVKKYQEQSAILLLAVNNVPSAKGIITGKIFEYLQAKRPILAIGPEDGDLANILEETKSGIIIGFDNEKQLKKEILKLYSSYVDNTLVVKSKNIEQYHRKNLTKSLSEIIKRILQ